MATDTNGNKGGIKPWLSIIAIVACCAAAAAFFLTRKPAPEPEEPEIAINYKNILGTYFQQPPILYLEAADASAFIDSFNGADISGRFFSGKTYSEFEKSKLYLKLSDRFAELSSLAGFDISLDSVKKFTGGRTAFMLFNIEHLHFVFISQMQEKAWAASNLYNLKNKYESRESNGVTYYIKEDENGALSFIFAFLRGNILVSNNSDFFFAYLDELERDPDIFKKASGAFKDVYGKDVAGEDVVMFIDRESIDNLYFRNYWIYDNYEDLKYILHTLITGRKTASGFKEARTMKFATGTVTPPGGDVSSAGLNAIPAGTAFVKYERTADSHAVAEKILVELFDDKTPDDKGGRAGDIAKLLEGAQPGSISYSAAGAFTDSPYMSPSRTVAIQFMKPGSFRFDEFRELAADILSSRMLAPGSQPFRFEESVTPGGESIFTIDPAIFTGSGISTAFAKGRLVIGVDNNSVSQVADGSTAELELESNADVVMWYDIPGIYEIYSDLTAELSMRNNWSGSTVELFRDNIGDIADMASNFETMMLERKIGNDRISEKITYTLP